MSYEWLKYVSPLLGVGFGAFIVPYIEPKAFEKKESRHAINCFYCELNDYLEDAPKYVKGFHGCYEMLKNQNLEL